MGIKLGRTAADLGDGDGSHEGGIVVDEESIVRFIYCTLLASAKR